MDWNVVINHFFTAKIIPTFSFDHAVGCWFTQTNNKKRKGKIMEAISITQTKDMIIELITQALFEKIEEACSKIEETFGKGLINLATQTIKNLSS